jgi:hypothetical protein
VNQNEPEEPAAGANGHWVKLGEVAVDGCRIGITDPSLVNNLTDDNPTYNEHVGDPWGSGVAFWSGFGDGGYDVWAWVVDYGEDDGERIAQIVVTMINDKDLKEWREDL